LAVDLSLCLLCSDLSDPSSLAERASDDQRFGSSDDTISVAKLPTVNSKPDGSPDYTVAGFLFR